MQPLRTFGHTCYTAIYQIYMYALHRFPCMCVSVCVMMFLTCLWIVTTSKMSEDVCSRVFRVWGCLAIVWVYIRAFLFNYLLLLNNLCRLSFVYCVARTRPRISLVRTVFFLFLFFGFNGFFVFFFLFSYLFHVGTFDRNFDHLGSPSC